MHLSFLRALGCALAAFALAPLAWAASPSKSAETEAVTTVPLFDAIKAGDIEVKLIPKDSTEGMLVVTNKTKKPLSIKMPPAFAGVPVAAQFGGGLGGGGMGGGGMGGGGGNQGMGGGMGGMGGMGGGGGMFNVGPEKVAKAKFVALCLDHGKKDPNPRVPYAIVPIESYAKDATVTEVVKLMVAGQIDQHSAQAAAWHLQSGLTWEELASKIGVKHLSGATEPYFNAVHLERALAATRIAAERAKDSKEKYPAKSVGEQADEQK